MADSQAPEFDALFERLDAAEGYLGLEKLKARKEELEPLVSAPDLWDDTDTARKVTTEYGRVSGDIEQLSNLRQRLEDARMLWDMGTEEADQASLGEAASEAVGVSSELDRLELQSLLGGEHDERDAICEIHSGEGGTDAQDWAEMMLRMYQRWAERRGFEVELDEVSPGQEAGIQSATFIVKGRHAYGLLCSERGVHRLYRISPFDSQARRQTSYAAFDVVPFIEDVSDEVEIDDKDLRVDTYRSSGAGGQHVNVTDSAVRITHLPTNIVVSCQNERSQLQNRAKAMQILAAKLAERARQARLEELAKISGPQGAVSRGGAFIRGYVMAPYQTVKDERTGHETGNVQATLDGDLDEFIEAWLRWRRSQEAGN
jgi:peptide chain release factor 2